VPARKKQPTEAGAHLATGRKKSAPSKAKTPRQASPATEKKRRSPAPTEGNGTHKQDLVIVESPTKAKTINKYLGGNFKVLASYGHVRDLPRRRRPGEVIAGVNLDGWVPTYVVEDKDDKRGGAKPAFKRRSTKEILAELAKLETEIQQGMEELEGMLR